MKKTNVFFLVGLSCFFVVLIVLAFQFQAKFYTSSYAEQIATEELNKYCKREQLLTSDFEGPTRASVGGSPWAFEWKYRGEKKLLFGVWLHQSGFPEIYIGED